MMSTRGAAVVASSCSLSYVVLFYRFPFLWLSSCVCVWRFFIKSLLILTGHSYSISSLCSIISLYAYLVFLLYFAFSVEVDIA
jgi:hypothetical protein